MAFASSQRIRSNITANIAVQSNFCGGIGQASWSIWNFWIVQASVVADRRRRRTPRGVLAPATMGGAAPSSAEAERLSPLNNSLRLTLHLPHCSLHQAPWPPHLLEPSSAAAVAVFSNPFVQKASPRRALPSPPNHTSFPCSFRSPPSVRSTTGTPLRLLFYGSRDIRSLTYPDRCVSSRGILWWWSRRRKVCRRRATAGQSAAPALSLWRVDPGWP